MLTLMNRPHVIVLDEELPYPANTGKRIRTLNLLRRLAKDFAIELVVHDSEDARHANMIRDLGITVQVAPGRIPAKAGPAFVLNLARSMVTRDPYSVASHRTRAYERTVRGRLERGRPAIVHAEWTPYAQYWRDGDPPLVVAAHNVESEVLERIARTHTSAAHRAFFGLQAKRMENFERHLFARAAHATAVSERDASQLRSWGCPDVEVVPNGVDTSYFAPRSGPMGESRTLVFTGSMDWRPNQDAIAWFARDVHPHLLMNGPYRLDVVGRDPPPRFREHAGLPPEITLTGTVEDVRPFVAASAIFVTPLRIGGGSRLKILEALAMEKPVVSTRIGAEGLDLVAGRDLLIADDGESFAAAVERLLTSPDLARQLAEAGGRVVRSHYEWDAVCLRQAAIWGRALG